MSRHRSFFVALAQANRAVTRYQNAQVRMQQKAIRDTDRQKKG